MVLASTLEKRFSQGLKTLKSFGFINTDLRKKINGVQHDYFVELLKEYSHIVKHPENYRR